MRKQIILDGSWIFLTDPDQQGLNQEWYMKSLSDKGTEVTVPHIWQRDDRFSTYTGAAWYQCEFHAEKPKDHDITVVTFDAVDYEAKVWLNGVYLGSHEGGYTPFEFNFDKALNEGVNQLTVRVYDPSDNAEIPIGKQGSWYSRVSGIWQSVTLEQRPAIHLKDIQIRPAEDLSGVWVQVTANEQLPDGLSLQISVTEHNGHEEIVGKEAQEEEWMFIKWDDIRLWSPEDPFLYDVTVRLVSGEHTYDEKRKHFGMRNVYQKDGDVWLNGQPLKIRGALDQAFYPDTIYSAPGEVFIKDEIQKAKQLGFNLLRKHIKIETPEYLYWADRMGMLIWEEPPNVVKFSAQANRRFKKDLLEMIKRDAHHPSIIIWSIYNEEWGLEWDLSNDSEKQRYVKELFEEVRASDATRLICDNSGWRHVVTDVNDTHRYFTVPEQSVEWKADLRENIIGSPDANFVPGQVSSQEPVIVSEFGVWGLPDPQDMIDYYGKQPLWYENLGDDTHKEDFKRPLTLFEHFERYQLNEVFRDYAELAACSQRRQFRANQGLIEEMRKERGINGYVVTELTDIEWETNGWMDYARNFKKGFEKANRFNGPLVVMADLKERNVWTGDALTAELMISNHDFRPLKGTLICEIPELNLQESRMIDEGTNVWVKLQEDIRFMIPEDTKTMSITLNLRLELEDGSVVENEYELTITKQEPARRQGIRVYTAYLPETFAEQLRRQGFDIAEEMNEADIAITGQLTKEFEESYIMGKQILFLAEDGDTIAEKGPITFREMDRGESWNRTSSMNYVNTAKFPEIPLQKEMGWEFHGIFPEYVIPMTNYEKIGGTVGRIVYMFGNSALADSSEILSGYFQGWAGQNGASMVRHYSAKGSLTITTWKLIRNYGKHPVGTSILNQLIHEFSNKIHN
ncbi:glycoside hydrolase family 2 protein [Salisediminibacterium selenitireducens]|uniref:Glycoside hydrolase family 2 sugar binding protein n=1 Tax=Bacillus selenitireducens (strain ATCC 700615 / DSM 15326 / MLS10) TaxID=439292 RepID=D6Y1C0_BACIE|nr:glycoside hydrolase family 2 [Salisediminibacterium selenitireducens]ADI00707.1 glycoside hydrolase family 2 sugar binding protein [[Bacillus] selenitireducens MLS10]